MLDFRIDWGSVAASCLASENSFSASTIIPALEANGLMTTSMQNHW